LCGRWLDSGGWWEGAGMLGEAESKEMS